MVERQQEWAFPEDEEALNRELTRLTDSCTARYKKLLGIAGFLGVQFPSVNRPFIIVVVDPLANGTTHEQIRAVMEDVPFQCENASHSLIDPHNLIDPPAPIDPPAQIDPQQTLF